MEKLKYKIDQDDFVTQYKWNYAGKLIEEIQYNKQATFEKEFEKEKVIIDDLDPKNRSHQYFYDKANYLAGEVLANGQVVKYTRDLQGHLLQKRLYVTPGQTIANWDNDEIIESINDQIDCYQLDLKGNTIKHINAENIETKYERDAANRLKKETCEGESHEYKHDKLNRTIQETHATGLQINSQYHANGKLEIEHKYDINDSNITHCNNYQYNGFAEKIKTIETETPYMDQPELLNYHEHNEKEVIVRDDAGLMVAKIDALGHKTHYYYDQLKRVRFTISPEGAVTEKRYNDSSNNPSSQIRFEKKLEGWHFTAIHGGPVTSDILKMIASNANDKADDKTYFKYDGRGNPISIIDGEGYEKIFKHDAFGDLIYTSQEVEKQNGENKARIQETNTEYDQLSRPTSILKGEQNKDDKREELFKYDDANARTEYLNAEQAKTVSVHDKLNREVLAYDELGNKTEKAWDGHNRIKILNMPTGLSETFTYFQGGKKVTKTTPLGQQFNTNNVFGETISEKIINNDVDLDTKTDRRNLNRYVTVTYADGSISEIQYDDAGRESILIDQMGVKTKFERDKDGFVSTKIEDFGGIERKIAYRRNGLGKITDECDANGVWRLYEHDKRGLVINTIIDPDGLGLTVKEAFDGLMQKTEHKEGDLKNDDQYRQTHQNDIFGNTQETSVDPDDLNLVSRTERNKLGKITKKIDAENRITYYIYDAKGQECFTINPEGVVKERCYDAVGHCTDEITHYSLLKIDETLFEDKEALLEPLDANRSKNDTHTQYVFDNQEKPAFSIKHLNIGNGVIHGVITKINYDALGNETYSKQYAQSIALNKILSLTPSAVMSGLIGVESDINNRESYKFYDELSRERYRVNHLGHLTETRYNPNGKITEVIKYANKLDLQKIQNIATSGIDGLLTRDEKQDRYTRSYYDSLNREIATVSPGGVVTKKEYDKKGNSIGECVFLERINTHLPYEVISSNIASWEWHSHSENRITQKKYDHNDKLKKIINAMDQAVEFKRNALGICETKIDERQQAWKFSFDRAKRLVSELSPETEITELIKGENGKLDSIVNRQQVETRRSYHENGGVSIIKGFGHKDARKVYFNKNSQGNITKEIVDDVEIDDPDKPLAAVSLTDRPTKLKTLIKEKLFNADGSELATQDNAGNWSYKVNDSLGRIIYEIDREGYVTQADHNQFDEVIKITRYAKSISELINKLNEVNVSQSFVMDSINSVCSVDSGNRVTLFSYQNNEVTVTKDEVEYYCDENDNSIDLPQTITRLNAFNQEIYKAHKIGKDSWEEHRKWYNQDGYLIGTMDPEGYVTIFKRSSEGLELERSEYASQIQLNQSLMISFEQLQDRVKVLPNAKDRHYLFEYDLLNRRTKKKELNVTVDFLEDETDGQSVKLGSKKTDLITTYEYQKDKIIITQPDGSQICKILDACGNIIREIGVVRTCLDQDEELKKIAPVITYGLNLFGEKVLINHHVNGVKDIEDTASIKEDKINDHIHLTSRDNRGLVKIEQDAEGNQQYKTYTENKKEARNYNDITQLKNIVGNKAIRRGQGKDQKLEAIKDFLLRQEQETHEIRSTRHIDEIRKKYDKCDRPVDIVTMRDNDEKLTSPHYQRTKNEWNGFGECEKQHHGDIEKGLVQERNKAGGIKYTNRDKGASSIQFQDLRGQDTLILKSAKVDLKNKNVSLKDLDKPESAHVERTESKRNRRGDPITVRMPFHFKSDNKKKGLANKYSWDRWRNQTKLKDADDNETDFEYNHADKLICITKPSELVYADGREPVAKRVKIKHAHNRMNQKIATINARNNIITHVLDEAGNDIGIVMPDGLRKTKKVRDIFSAVLKDIDARGKKWQYQTNKMNQPVLLTKPSGEKNSYGYDEKNRQNKHQNLSSRKNRSSEKRDQIDISNYDARGNIFQSVLPGGQVHDRRFDRNQQLTKLSIDGVYTQDWQRDFFGNKESYTDIKRVITSYILDNKKQIIEEKAATPHEEEMMRLHRDMAYLGVDKNLVYQIAMNEFYEVGSPINHCEFKWEFGLLTSVVDYMLVKKTEYEHDNQGRKNKSSTYQMAPDFTKRSDYKNDHGKNVVMSKQERLIHQIKQERDAYGRVNKVDVLHRTGSNSLSRTVVNKGFDEAENNTFEAIRVEPHGYSQGDELIALTSDDHNKFDENDQVMVLHGKRVSSTNPEIIPKKNKGIVMGYKDGLRVKETFHDGKRPMDATIISDDNGEVTETMVINLAHDEPKETKDIKYQHRTTREKDAGGQVFRFNEFYITTEWDNIHDPYRSYNRSTTKPLYSVNGWAIGSDYSFNRTITQNDYVKDYTLETRTWLNDSVNFPLDQLARTRRDKMPDDFKIFTIKKGTAFSNWLPKKAKLSDNSKSDSYAFQYYTPKGILNAKIGTKDEAWGQHGGYPESLAFYDTGVEGYTESKLHLNKGMKDKSKLVIMELSSFQFGRDLEGNIFTCWWEKTDHDKQLEYANAHFDHDETKDKPRPELMSEELPHYYHVRQLAPYKPVKSDGINRPIDVDESYYRNLSRRQHMVQPGETLASITSNDPEFQRIIKRDNPFLADQPLRVGMHIEIPEYVANTMKADNHRPYNEFLSHMRGSIMPHLKHELDDHDDELIKIIAIAVAAVVVITVAQWAAPQLATFIVGAEAVKAGTTAAIIAEGASAALVAGGMDVGMQELQVQAGLQDHYSFAQTATMMATAGTGASAGAYAKSAATTAVAASSAMSAEAATTYIAGEAAKATLVANMMASAISTLTTQLIEMRNGSRSHFDLLSVGANLVAAYVGAKAGAAINKPVVQQSATRTFMTERAKSIGRMAANSLMGAAVTHTDPNIQAMAANAIGTTAMDVVTSYMSSENAGVNAHHSAEYAAQEKDTYCAFNPAPASAYEQGVYQEQQHLVQHQAASELSLLASEQGASTLPTIQSALGHAGYSAINAVKSTPQVLLEEASMPVYKRAFNSVVDLARTAATLINGDINAKAEVLGGMVGTAGVTALAGGAVGLAGSRLSLFSPAPRVGMGAQFGEVSAGSRYYNVLFSANSNKTQLASSKLVNQISAKRDLHIAKPGSDEFRFLEMVRAEASAGGPGNKSILVRSENPQRLTLMEEYLHGTQSKIWGDPDTSSATIAFREWHVRDFMYRHKDMLGWDNQELSVLSEEKNYWHNQYRGVSNGTKNSNR